MGTSRSRAGDVVSIGKHSAWKADFKSLASQCVRRAREKLGRDQAEFAALLTELLGWGVTEAALARWERGATPPGDVLLAATAAEESSLIASPVTLLGQVPHTFPAEALDGPWVTSYQFFHGDTRQYHVDIAHVKAESDRQLRAVNHPPEPRTEGRASPFRNEIEIRLFNRHRRTLVDARSWHRSLFPVGRSVVSWFDVCHCHAQVWASLLGVVLGGGLSHLPN